MAIIQISKVLVRTGDEQDLPQLDTGEFGYSTDVKKLYIGDDPNNNPENLVINNTEVLTEHSTIAFSQIDLTNGANFTTENLHISGGQNGYVLETDGTGNISWGSKGSLVYSISNITSANPALVTFTSNHIFTNSQLVTISDVNGVVNLTAGSLTGSITANTTTPTVTGNGTSFTSEVAVGQTIVQTSNTNSIIGTVLSIANNTSLTLRTSSFSNISSGSARSGPSGVNSTTAYVKVIASNQVELYADSALTTGVNTSPYTNYYSGGRVVGLLSSGGGGAVGGSNTQVQFNNNGVFGGSANLTYNYTTGLLAVTGVANVTGNLNVSLNSNLGNLATANYFSGVITTNAQPNITSTGTLTSLSVSGNANVGNLGTSGLITATGNGTFGNVIATLHVGNLSGTGNSNVGNIGATRFVGNLSGTGNSNVGNLGVTGLITATGNVNSGNINTTGVFATNLSLTGNANVGNLGTTGLITATGNITGDNVIGTLHVGNISGTGNSNVGNLGATGIFSTTLSATGNANVGNINVSGLISVSGNITANNFTSSSYIINSVATGITAAGTTQGTATAITKTINVVSTVISGANGVVLPTAVAGMTIYITNSSANALNVFPASGAAINTGATNASLSQDAGATLHFIAPTTTQWYSVGATYA